MMKAICLVTFLTCFVVVITAHQSEQSIPSFLKFIGSYKYNTTDNGKITLKRYYSSHRIIYKWIEAYTICKSVGMRLAFIESDNERNNLAAMGRKNSKLFERKIFVDGYNLTVTEFDYESDGSEKEPCFSAQKYRRGKLEIRSEKCNVELNRFLCERMEIVDSYDEHQASDDKIDVKGTFFAHIGSFETKQYYASFKLKAHSSDVPKICRSFGMQMASPKNQAEYDNLGRLLQEFNDKWNSVSIAGYRSDDNESEWVVSNRKPNYEMVWGDGEPNNRGESEDCIALKNNGRPKMNDIPCHSDDQFVCESDESITDVNIPHQIDPLLLKPLTDYKIDSTHRKELFISLFNVDWITANLMCRTSGMELFTPSSTADDETLRNKLNKFTGISDSLHVGITSMGTEDVWYSVNTGEILDFDLEWAPQYSSMYYASNTNCLKVRKSYEKYAYDAIACTNTPNHFICQKVVEATEDQQTTTSKSPAS